MPADAAKCQSSWTPKSGRRPIPRSLPRMALPAARRLLRHDADLEVTEKEANARAARDVDDIDL